ncbi:MAG: hypothetical protein IT431_07735 [Phycisphaerales bacterium]|nr:hypothetical protein [Phycisphaerales bacterium]
MDRPYTEHAATPNGRHQPDGPRDHEMDELADMFLGPAEQPGGDAPSPDREAPHAVPRPSRRARLEGVILGHLPISASAWPGQYARRRAEQTGAPVAVVKLAGGALTIDLIGAGNPDRPPESDREALAAAGRLAQVIILRVEEPAEARLAALPLLDTLCVLTGADDAAVVACYRKLKALAGSPPGVLPAVRLTVMGADDGHGRRAHDRIARAAKEFLEADLLDPVIIDRIGPTGSTAVYRGPSALSIEDIGRILTERPAEPARPVPASIPTLTPTLTPTLAPAIPPSPSPAPPEPIARQDEHRARPDGRLSSLVPGVDPLESRCAAAPQVELAVDDQGRLHLIAARLASVPTQSSADAMGDLVRVAGWAHANSSLLARAEPRVLAADPVLHLITDDASGATSLAGPIVRVHLAVPARPMAFGLTAVPLGV